MNVSLQILVVLSLSFQGSAKYPRPDLLVEPMALIAGIEKYRILDARPKAKFAQGHLPGAVWVDHGAWAKAFAASQAVDVWGPKIAALGIDGKTPVAIYDDGSTKDAARIWWILKYFNVQQVHLVHAGWHGLQDAKAPTTDKPTVVASSTITLRAPAQDRLADRAGVLSVLKKKSDIQIIDTRSGKEYCGDTKLAKRGGAIPGAIHLEWTDAIDPKTKRFKSADELTTLFKNAGIDLKKKSITHCQSGGRAAVMAFALELIGADGVANYYRSWSEWGNDPQTPIVLPRRK